MKNLNIKYLINFFVALIFLTPIVMIFSKGLFSIFIIEDDIYLSRYFFGSLIMLVSVAILVLVISIPLAWLTTMTEFKGRKIIQILAILPLAVPGYISAYAYAEILEPSGFMTALLSLISIDFIGISIRNSFFGSIILALSLFPYVYLLTRISIINLSARYIEAGRTIGKTPFECFFKIGIPMSVPGIIAGLALALMETVNDFGVASFFGLNTLSIGIYNYISILNNLNAAFFLSLVVILMMLVLYIIEQKIRGKKNFHNSNYEFLNWKRFKLTKIKGYLAFYIGLIPIILGYFIPVLFTLYLYLDNFSKIRYGNFFNSLFNTLIIGFIVAIVCALISVLLNFSGRFSKRKIFLYLKKIINTGYAIPGVVVALGVIYFLISIDKILVLLFSNNLLISSSVLGLVLALSIRLISLSNNSIDSGLEKISSSIDDASRMMGRRYSTTYFRIILPQIKLSVIAGIFLVMVDTMKELPITLLLRPFNFNTLATELYQYSSSESVELGSLHALTIIIFLTIAVFLVDNILEKKLISKSEK
ncbi:iron ABC transporter permease [Alphaproteobacteria bacterium]|nr:iron ABC transporter permease [Alphaproteobacteria bacterium]